MRLECAECERLWSEYSSAHQEFMRLTELRMICEDNGTPVEPNLIRELELGSARRLFAKKELARHKKQAH